MNSNVEQVRAYLENQRELLNAIDPQPIAAAATRLISAYKQNRTVFICGNGGSASTASHMAADLGKNTVTVGRARLRVISLNDNTPLITAITNDLGYERVFEEQIANLVQAEDVLIAISASGNSPNILRTAQFARNYDTTVIALTGADGGQLAKLADIIICVPSTDYGPIEDLHLSVNHIFTNSLRHYINREN